MRTQSRVGLTSLAAVGLLACFSCDSDDPVAPRADRIYIEVQVSGGIASAEYAYAVDGDELAVRGVTCSSGCDFEPGEVVTRLTPAQVLYFADMLIDAGIHGLDGRDFGDECCDQFHYVIGYRDGDRDSSVRGSTGALPQDLASAVAELDLLVRGVTPIIIDWTDATRGDPIADVARSSIILQGAALTDPSAGWFHDVYLKRYFRLYHDNVHHQYRAWRPIVAAVRLTENIAEQQEWLLAQVKAGLG